MNAVFLQLFYANPGYVVVKSNIRALCWATSDVFRGVYYLAKLCYETIYLQICDEIT